MGDDPYIDAMADNRSAQIVNIESLGRGGIAVIIGLVGIAVAMSALALGNSMGLESRTQDKINASEKRVMDVAWLAKQEAALSREDFIQLRGELAKHGIAITEH